MANSWFQFKQFTIRQDKTAMKVTTDTCLFGAWVAKEVSQSNHAVSTLLDIGTGTGLLSLMIVQENKVIIDAVEIDEDTFRQAQENVSSSKWKNSIHVIHTDILNWKSDKKYDLIVSNPPFYEKEIPSAEPAKNIAHHSHHLKISELLNILKEKLNEDGSFFLLLPAKRQQEIDTLLLKRELYIHKKVLVRQSVNHSPFRIMINGSFTKSEVSHSEIAIADAERNYTEEFSNLLKSYYLKL